MIPAHFKARLAVGIIMLLLGLIGIIVTDFASQGAWNYWRGLAIVYALMSLSLSLHLKKLGVRSALFTIWHEVFHWTGLVAAIFLISYFVHTGIEGRFQGALQALTVLALATYLAGIYLDKSFIPVGILLGLFAGGTAFFEQYIYSVLLPLTIITAVVLVIIIRFTHHSRSKNDPDRAPPEDKP